MQQSIRKPVFLLGVGAQKSGTTWMWSYLNRHPQCAMGRIKEYAVFQAAFLGNTFPVRRRTRLEQLAKLLTGRRNQLVKGEEPTQTEAILSLMDNIALELDLDRYIPHFCALLDSNPGTQLVADITPEYCALTPEHLTRIRTMLTEGGFDVRVVYLMRDPVERCFSMLRMGDRNAGKGTNTTAHQRFAIDAKQPWCERHTRYDRTIPNLEQVFRPEELHFDLYEDFISERGVRALTKFLGIDYTAPNLDHRANASPRDAEPEADAIAEVRAYYEPVYAFCRERFGDERIASLWKHA
ncbi:sulfotransferase [Pararhodobacter marinus]|uniref:sulfotransferase n=1 Tax=Pararhodobacter marinus TaxID=2184063 RepID=UPI0035134D6A